MTECSTVNFQSLSSGKYIVQKYKPIVVKDGSRITHIITALHNNQQVEFWSNQTLTNYIKSAEPRQEFEIIVNRQEVSKEGLAVPYPNSIVIPGYLREVVLTKKVL
jgi:hypothetical protein